MSWFTKSVQDQARKVYDWKNRYWGNDYVIWPRDEGQFASITGWRSDLRVGDVLLLYHGKDKKNRAAYVIDSIKYKRDPHDMFSAEVHYEQGLVDDELNLTREPKAPPRGKKKDKK